ncbi:DUF4132 domain-containing protein [Nocardia mangyaensis]|uniref:DUF4132 domain-containing protein n=1 Tax=Nocardia mangyaensis TaxID=2213200 RepID=UPI0026744FC1|nr:DUF4132 domain-containing protein [Nocardia mangyaensis]MDO3647885.1 DUF4132 domain-containing protein [Nocardia mangyaensis]
MGDVEVDGSDGMRESGHDLYADIVREEREALWQWVDRARADAGDPIELRGIAEQIRVRLEEGDDRANGTLVDQVGDIVAALDELYDAAFPPGDAYDITSLLVVPWPSVRRKSLLAAYLDVDVRHRLLLDDVAAGAIAAADVELLRALVLTPLGALDRQSVARVLDALHRADALDAAVVERAFTDDRYLGYAIVGRDGQGEVTGDPLGCADAVRTLADAMTWRLASAPDPAGWDVFPKAFAPRGLRFVRLALAWQGEEQVAEHLGAAELTDAERRQLLDDLREHPTAVQRKVFGWRGRAGDSDALLPLFGLADSARLLRMIRAIPADQVTRQDRAALLAAIEAAGVDNVRRLLTLVSSELVSAVLGWNRAQVLKRVKNNALQGIAAFGMLPLAPGETVLDRYLALRGCAKKGAKLGPNRRISHAAAIEVALDHLAQVAGVGEAGRLEWDCEARLATDTPTEAMIGDYRILLRFNGAEPELRVSRGDKELKSVPSTVRADPAYRELREHQESRREQARRMRTGLLERLVATGATVAPDELARWRTLPAGAAMLPALLWRDRAGVIGLLDEVDTTGPMTAVHPADLHEQGTLTQWRTRLARQGLEQPVKQVFRELYPLTPTERTADVSRRFDGRLVDGATAVPLLSSRGWSTHGRYDDYQATRPAGTAVAAVRCEFGGYFGQGEVRIGDIRFLAEGRAVPLADLASAVFSEVMRDLDLVVSVAATAARA